MKLESEAFLRTTAERVSFCNGPDQPIFVVPWTFPFVSALRWDSRTATLIATATPPGSAEPAVRKDDKGHLALYRWPVGAAAWDLLYAGYAHDPVVIDGGYAVHRGAGLTFLDESGVVDREHKVGRFNWGPPSLSAMPDSDRVAWIRWRGDDRLLCVEDRLGQASTELRSSVDGYAWLSADTVVWHKGQSLRTLNLGTGRTEGLGSMREAARGGELPELVLEYMRSPKAEYRLVFRHLSCMAGRLWFVADFHSMTGVLPHFHGLFVSNADASAWSLVVAPSKGSRIEGFEILDDLTFNLVVARYEGTRIVARDRQGQGPSADFLSGDWVRIASSQEPNFGFHRLPD